MFSHKFFMLEPYVSGLLEQYKASPGPQMGRFCGFMLFAHHVFGWFAKRPQLLGIKLTAVTLPEFEKNPLSIRLRHHFKLESTPGTQAPVENINDFALQQMPYEDISHGVFRLERSDPLVQSFLALDAQDNQPYLNLVFELACRADLALAGVSVLHDLGPTPALDG